MNLILQIPSTAETRAVRMAAMLLDRGAVEVVNARLETLPTLASVLEAGAVPVGSVEYVRRAMGLAGIAEPPNISYPAGITPYLRREIKTVRLGEVTQRCFLKPATTKLFTGFVFDPSNPAGASDPHAQEQDRIVRALPPETLVHTSTIETFVCEWRYYIKNNTILGCARYDPDGPDNAPQPDQQTIIDCMQAIDLPHPYALDAAVHADGATAIVEINDSWALGLYRGAITDRQYLDFLVCGWDSLRLRAAAALA